MPQRGVYDTDTIKEILDEALFCHLSFVEDTQPVTIPTLHARVGDLVYVHGSSASRTLRAASKGVQVCLVATLIDGLVLARSAFHHSVNYRSVVVFGAAAEVVTEDAKERALEAFTEKLIPGRWADVRSPSRQELKATSVLQLPLTEASAKVRRGPPLDDDDDYDRATWAGVLPLQLQRLPLEPDPLLQEEIPIPPYLDGRSQS